MRIKIPQDVSNLEGAEFQRYVSQGLKDIGELINGRLDLNENCATQQIEVNFAAASTNTAVSHTISKVPSGYIVVSRSANIQIFNGTGTNTDKILYLASSAAGLVSLLVY